jgi:holliday junction DNA helicase RuvA
MDSNYAKLGGFFQQQFEPLKLYESYQKRDRTQWLRIRKLLEHTKHNVLLAREIDLCQVQPLVVADLVELPRLDAQNLREMARLVACQLRKSVVHTIDEEASPRHDSNVACMIAQLRGTLLEKRPNQAIVDVGGVGYDVAIPVSTYSALPDAGSEVKLRVHTHVREDAIALFGFASADEKSLFEKLIGVSGIGPKLAITVLSGLATPDLVTAIRASQTERLVRIPGVGKKTAERIVLELKDKLEGVGGPAVPVSIDKPAVLSEVEMDVLSALVNLGCQRSAAESAIRKAAAAGAGAGFEPLFRRSLELVR